MGQMVPRKYTPGRPTLESLYSDTVVTSSGCLEWQCARDKDGYGKISIYIARGKNEYWRLHRLVWVIAHGPITKDQHVLHQCDNPPCINLEHLFVGSYIDNIKDCIAKGRATQYRMGNGQRKLDLSQVLAIREDDRTLHEIAAAYGMGASQISRIKRGQRWWWA